MNNRFRFIPNKKTIIAAVVAILFMLAWLIYTAIMLSDALANDNNDITIYVVSLIVLFLLLSLIIAIMTLPAYVFKESYFVFTFVAFNKKINYEDILLIKHDTKTNMLLMYFKLTDKDEEEKFNYINVCIKLDCILLFIATAKKKNDKIVYETFDKDNDNTDSNDKLA